MKVCKICGKEANTDRLLCKECYRISRLKNTESMPKGIEFMQGINKYIVTEDGRAYSIKSMRYLAPIPMPNGYYMYSFGNNEQGTRRQYYIHRLVAFCYGLLSSIDENISIDHIDGNKANCSLENLRICTASENELYKNNRLKGILYAKNNTGTYGPYLAVKDMYNALNIKGTLGSFYTQVSRGSGYGYTFVRENI